MFSHSVDLVPIILLCALLPGILWWNLHIDRGNHTESLWCSWVRRNDLMYLGLRPFLSYKHILLIVLFSYAVGRGWIGKRRRTSSHVMWRDVTWRDVTNHVKSQTTVGTVYFIERGSRPKQGMSKRDCIFIRVPIVQRRGFFHGQFYNHSARKPRAFSWARTPEYHWLHSTLPSIRTVGKERNVSDNQLTLHGVSSFLDAPSILYLSRTNPDVRLQNLGFAFTIIIQICCAAKFSSDRSQTDNVFCFRGHPNKPILSRDYQPGSRSQLSEVSAKRSSPLYESKRPSVLMAFLIFFLSDSPLYFTPLPSLHF